MYSMIVAAAVIVFLILLAREAGMFYFWILRFRRAQAGFQSRLPKPERRWETHLKSDPA